MTLSLNFAQYVDAIVVTQRARHLVIVHAEMVLLNAPQARQSRRVHDLEHAGVAVFPSNVAGVPLLRIIQQLLEKVPEETSVGARFYELVATEVRRGLMLLLLLLCLRGVQRRLGGFLVVGRGLILRLLVVVCSHSGGSGCGSCGALVVR